MPEDHICFSLRRRISRVIICLVQPLRVPRFPKVSLFFRTMPSTHFTQTTYFGWCRYFFARFRSSPLLLLYNQWLQQTSLHLMQQVFSLDQAVFKACFKKRRHQPLASALEISYRLSTNHNQEFRCAIYTGITLIALVLHFFALCYIRPALLSANLTRVLFSCILSNVIHDSFIIDTSLITCKLRFFRRISWITTFSWKKK